MSDIKINSQDELMNFLKIVAEEAYTMSLDQVNESTDPAVQRWEQSFKANKAQGYTLKEVEEEEAKPQTEEEAEESPATDNQAVTPEKKPEPFTASFDSVMDAINKIRSGLSLKDREIRESLRQYYDALSEAERAVWMNFMQQTGRILTDEVEGDEALDPSDPPLKYKIISADEEADQKADDAVGDMSGDEEEADSPEDTSPPGEADTPIAVNESQEKSFLREKVRLLMRT